MSTLQKSNTDVKNQNISTLEDLEGESEEYGLEDFESDFDVMADESLSVMGDDEEIEAVAADRYSEEKPQITLKQIRELEKKAVEAMKNQDPDPELLKILQQAEQNEIQAEFNEKFSDAAHQGKALEMKRIALELFRKAKPMVEKEESEAVAAEELKVKAEADQAFSETLGEKLVKGADKVGAVHYDFHKEMNGWAIAASIFCLGLPIASSDVSVKAQINAAYSVGFRNLDKNEFAADMFGEGDKTTTSEGSHSHAWGDDIKSEDFYKRLEAQGQAEATDVKNILTSMGNALKEPDANKKSELWSQTIKDLENWNIHTEKATVYNRAQLLFNAAIGELGEGNLKKAIADKLIPEEFSSKLGEMLDSLPADMKPILENKDDDYFTGGASDRNWSSKKSSDFVRIAVDPEYASLERFEKEAEEGAEGEEGDDATEGNKKGETENQTDAA